ncbi:hypothetical protein D3C79_908890 [compost metagenome]
MRHRQRLVQQPGTPEHPEGRDHEGHGAGFDRADFAQQAEIKNVGKRGTHQAQAQQRQPHLPAAPARQWLGDHAVSKQRQQQQGRPHHAAQGRQPAVEAALMI